MSNENPAKSLTSRRHLLSGTAKRLRSSIPRFESGSASDAAVAAEVGVRQRTSPSARSEIPRALCAAALASGIGAWVLEIWRANLRVPFVYNSDGLFELMTLKEVLDHGWDLSNPNLGAPFGQETYDFPAHSGDSLYLLIVKVLGVFSGDFALVANVFFLLFFPLIAIVSYLVLRRLGISAWVAVVVSALFAVLPGRFDNGEVHLMLGAYFTVPVSCYLVLMQLEGRELFRRDGRHPGLRAYITPRSAGILLVCVVIGSTGNYYAMFTVGLIAIASVLVFLARRRLRPFICALVAMLAVLGTVALNGLPAFIYVQEHGRDTAVAHRVPAETDIYGLVLTQLVLPIEGHRIPAFAHITERYLSSAPLPATGETGFDTLGGASVIGLLYLAVALAARGIGERRGGRGADAFGVGDELLQDRTAVRAALGAGVAFLIGTVGGLATLFAYLVNPQLRAPNRIAIFIGFFGLLGLALALERLRRWSQGRGRARIGFAAVLVAVLALATLDQTSPKMTPKYAAVSAKYNSDARFVRAIERLVPPKAAIFQLPLVEFPEGEAPGGEGWEQFVGYLHSSQLRWSFGAMRGRATDWQAALAGAPLSTLLPAISAAGFSGVYFNAFAFADGGAAIVSELSHELDVAPLVSENRGLYFFNMAGYNQRLRQRLGAQRLASMAQATLHPFGG